MARYEVGDHVSWNSEAGRIRGRVINIHTADFEFRGRTRHCSAEEPQYELTSDKTGTVAVHKGSALTRLRS
ncbi:DUF2945 domain-containing protein [Paracoccus suum]|uniref:DUF2945 domain-containing protein n=1 Tax=Paracoccus suum TaxID=2259340 RepID=A0A344PIT6_9RHOB|nr:DUF2945 domain-containing protein [Paracoccus suum]AXC49291.1 DUF2945 domain-containing protein [Paracoccus suum]